MVIPKSTLPMKLSAMLIMKITIKSAHTSIRIASSMPAMYARPKVGAAKEDHPVIIKPRELATIVITMATNPIDLSAPPLQGICSERNDTKNQKDNAEHGT